MCYKYILIFLLFTFFSLHIQVECAESIEGKIMWTEENFVFVNLGNKQKIQKNMVLDVYDKNNKIIGVIEVTSVIEEELSMARAYMPITKVKKDFIVRPQSERGKKTIEIPLGEVAIKVKKADLIKTFSAFINDVGTDKEDIDLEKYRGKMQEDLFSRAIETLKINVPNMLKDENKRLLLKKFNADDFINIVSKELIFNGQSFNIFYRAEVNISQLIEKLKENGYVLRAKRLIIEIPDLNQFDTRDIVKEVSAQSLFLGEEILDNQSPIPVIVYTTPKLFAQELLRLNFGKFKITLQWIREDTIKFIAEKSEKG